jgi:hypothetical protein
MSCYQVNITGTGAASPLGVVVSRRLLCYQFRILIDIYSPITNNVVHGPAVLTG